MSSPYKTKQFKALQKKWYKKLEKSGFEEIENTNSPNEMLKQWHSHKFSRQTEAEKKNNGVYLRFKAKETYFQNAAWFLENYIFDTSREKEIWKLHSEGFSIRESAKALDVWPIQIFRVLKKLKTAMGIK